MQKLTEIEGIADTTCEKLNAAGCNCVDSLLKNGSTPKGRAEIAEKSGVSPKLVLKFVNHADLFRIKGVAGQFAELLELAGVDTVPELAQRNAANLHAKLVECNEAKHTCKVVPSESQIQGFIDQAKDLPRAINY